jgi:hypothetical protein
MNLIFEYMFNNFKSITTNNKSIKKPNKNDSQETIKNDNKDCISNIYFFIS